VTEKDSEIVMGLNYFPSSISEIEMTANSKNGFSLVEVLVVVGLLAIVLSLAVPSFQGLMSKSRLSLSSDQLYTALVLARSEAVKSNRRVTVCGRTTTNDCGVAAWMNGSIVFVDHVTKGVIDDTTEIVKVFYSDAADILLSTENINNSVSFNPDGSSDTSGAFILCAPSATISPLRICISQSGTVIQTSDSCLLHEVKCAT
jgi:type IV fimbrial biogenesis protein FimT